MINRSILLGLLSLGFVLSPLTARYTVDQAVAQDIISLTSQAAKQADLTSLPQEVQDAVNALHMVSSEEITSQERTALIFAVKTALMQSIGDGSFFAELDTDGAMIFADILIKDLLDVGISKKKPLTVIAARTGAFVQSEDGSINPHIQKCLEFCRLVEEFLNPGAGTKVKPLMYYCDKFSALVVDDAGEPLPGLEKVHQFFTANRSTTKMTDLSKSILHTFDDERKHPMAFAEKTLRAIAGLDQDSPYASLCDRFMPFLCDESGTVKQELADLHAFLEKHRTSKHLRTVLEDAQTLGTSLQKRHQSSIDSGAGRYVSQWNILLKKLEAQYSPTAIMSALQKRLLANKRFIQARSRA